MDFLEQIKNLSDKELKKVVKKRIEELEDSNTENETINIGFDLESNFRNYGLFFDDNNSYFDFDTVPYYEGYIKKGTKITYGIVYNNLGSAACEGQYYYMDSDDYIYEFCKFMRDKEVINEYELFDYVLEFLRKYFGKWEDISRSQMFRLICNDKGEYFQPTKEHSIKDFKGKGNAMCTEYSAVAQNILSVFGIKTSIVIGNEELVGQPGGMHAFNIVSFNEKETGEEVNALIDFSAPASVHDINLDVIGVSPYIIYLQQYDDEFIEDLVYNERKIVAEDYGYFMFGDTMISIAYENGKRCYHVNNLLDPEYKMMTKK